MRIDAGLAGAGEIGKYRRHQNDSCQRRSLRAAHGAQRAASIGRGPEEKRCGSGKAEARNAGGADGAAPEGSGKQAFLRDVLEAFDFQLIGEEVVGGRRAYVLHATPHPGYHAHGKFGRCSPRWKASLVDTQDFGWIKVDGEVTQPFSMGLFVARVQRGSHIILEQNMCR